MARARRILSVQECQVNSHGMQARERPVVLLGACAHRVARIGKSAAPVPVSQPLWIIRAAGIDGHNGAVGQGGEQVAATEHGIVIMR